MTLSSISTLLLACLIRLGPGESERVVTLQQVKFYEDRSRELTFNAVLQEPGRFFSYNPSFIPANYNPASAYWVSYDFCVPSDNYLMEFYDQTIDSIQVFLRHESDPAFTEYVYGDQQTFENRQFNHKNFEIELNKAGQYYGYVRVVNREYADIRVAIRTINRFVDYALSEYYFYGIFYGMILIIALYNFSLYSAIREIKYLYYTLYVLSVAMFAMCVDGIAYQKLWPSHPNWNAIAHGVALYSIIFWSILFSKKFLSLKTRAPKIDQLVNVIFVLRSLLFLYSLLIDPRLFSYRYIEIIPLSIIFLGSIYTYVKGYKPARFFIVAYGFLFLGFVVKALLLFSVIPVSWYSFKPILQTISYYSLHLCFVFEMLFLSLALSDRIRILKANKDRAFRRIVEQREEHIRYKDQLNAQLERKIAERTIELAEKNELLLKANEDLQTQKTEISEINSILDLDNWKLRNNIKSIHRERILNKHLSYHEFKLVFPDKIKCTELLSELKWKGGFSCKKCGNKKYLRGTALLSRRCTTCGYNETPTTDTVFHSLKFPLEKAFYLLYLYLNNDETPLSQLSETLDLRKNTIWAFKRKIKDYESRANIDELNIFKDLVLEPIY